MNKKRFDAFEFRRKYPFAKIVDPLGGIVGDVMNIKSQELGVPQFHRTSADLGDLSQSYPWIRAKDGKNLGRGVIGGAGSDLDTETGCIRAVVEAAERYATAVFTEDEVCIASAVELGGGALDYRRWPQCSEDEYANPRCILNRLQPTAPIRWIKGYSLISHRPMWVPLVMSHVVFNQWPEEMFWLPISTGVAAHTDPFRAAVSAICELIERDAITLTWLARLTPPKIVFDSDPPAELKDAFSQLQILPIKQHFFDATTDFGVPIIYSVQFFDGHPSIANFVACSVEFDPWQACAKVIREAANGRTGLEQNRILPPHQDLFYSLEDGAHYMGKIETRSAFDFLFENDNVRSISEMISPVTGNVHDQFHWLVNRFKKLDFELVLIDLTTDDLRDVGISVIRAFSPDLMPLDFAPASRFKGHARLFDYPEKAGYSRRSFSDLNPYPQPFA